MNYFPNKLYTQESSFYLELVNSTLHSNPLSIKRVAVLSCFFSVPRLEDVANQNTESIGKLKFQMNNGLFVSTTLSSLHYLEKTKHTPKHTPKHTHTHTPNTT